MGYIHENEEDEFFGRGLEDALEIQQRVNKFNELMERYLGMTFPREDDDILSAEFITDDN